MTVLISACLMGVPCRFDGKMAKDLKLRERLLGHKFVLACPELLGGLGRPREPAEIKGAAVLTKSGEDVTEAFRLGAARTLAIAMENGCRAALLKARSPSCGKGKVHDGTFSKRLADGNGLTAALLLENGIDVFTEEELDSFFARIAALEH